MGRDSIFDNQGNGMIQTHINELHEEYEALAKRQSVAMTQDEIAELEMLPGEIKTLSDKLAQLEDRQAVLAEKKEDFDAYSARMQATEQTRIHLEAQSQVSQA